MVFKAYDIYEEMISSHRVYGPSMLDDDCSGPVRSNYNHTYPEKILEGLRNEVIRGAVRRLCPMCGQREASTLDHFLPKEIFPEYSIFPLNLIPACPECNTQKRSYVGDHQTRLIHAYLDDLSNCPSVLYSDIEVFDDGPVITFSPNEHLPDSIYTRVKKQFEVLKLSACYSWASVTELIQRSDTFEADYKDGGAELVAAEAREHSEYLSRKFGRNYWMASLYEGVSRSRDFCDGGWAHFDAT
ncbi:HNH endonuclease signature motif containing protein [Nocardia sp. NPDC050718]|uniref:HNH endonuclease n=1 Tax=Nocardia sp. NPDC050718 TaxID=3155788 RepID=UPI00340C35D6